MRLCWHRREDKQKFSESPPSSRSEYQMSIRDPIIRRNRYDTMEHSRSSHETQYHHHQQSLNPQHQHHKMYQNHNQYSRSPIYSDDSSVAESYRREREFRRYQGIQLFLSSIWTVLQLDSTPQDVSEDDDPMPTAIRARRLPLISTMPTHYESAFQPSYNQHLNDSYGIIVFHSLDLIKVLGLGTGYQRDYHTNHPHSHSSTQHQPMYSTSPLISPRSSHSYYTPRSSQYYEIPSPSPDVRV